MPSKSAAIGLRSINSLLVDKGGSPARYWIPAYQRGYRWDRLQVTQLLDDIWEFIQASEENRRTSFYCLQPLVVRSLEDGRYEVVDGQQRLTTIFILLSHRKEILALLGKQRFSINYETRDRTFLQEIDLDRSNENVDFYHICEAWRAIECALVRPSTVAARPCTSITRVLARSVIASAAARARAGTRSEAAVAAVAARKPRRENWVMRTSRTRLG